MRNSYIRSAAILAMFVVSGLMLSSFCRGQTRLDEAPINYHTSKDDNRVSRLVDRIRAGEIELAYQPRYGQLKSILAALDIPVSSQVLVYSKTSLQSGRISPTNPRAIFFNDDTYVGWVRGSSLLEISTADPVLGAVFYTVRMSSRGSIPRRQNNGCLACHELPKSQGRIPGHFVQSVMTRDSGKINLLLDSFVTDHASPFAERWGGWYVTGGHGEPSHFGNSFLRDDEMVAFAESPVTDLSPFLEIGDWPTPHSDIVALMVMEHQMHVQNQFARAHYEFRRAKYVADQSESDDAAEQMVREAVSEAADRVVRSLLFFDEYQLRAPVVGSGPFTKEFQSRGLRSKEGRSLRDFDLETRMFQFPCSYLIHSPLMKALPDPLKQQIYQRLLGILTAEPTTDDDFAYLDKATRQNILEILKATHEDLPPEWSREG